jgi:hypothetical protein
MANDIVRVIVLNLSSFWVDLAKFGKFSEFLEDLDLGFSQIYKKGEFFL